MPRRDLISRVFASSTFSDLVAERNALEERVFPRLREYCRSRGARIQAIDWGWGVSQEASLDQQTMNICLQELRRCQELSSLPNFIVVLGGPLRMAAAAAADRSGRIRAETYTAMRGVMAMRSVENHATSEITHHDRTTTLPRLHLLRPRERVRTEARR